MAIERSAASSAYFIAQERVADRPLPLAHLPQNFPKLQTTNVLSYAANQITVSMPSMIDSSCAGNIFCESLDNLVSLLTYEATRRLLDIGVSISKNGNPSVMHSSQSTDPDKYWM
jgi:hypothetical protein